MHFTERNGQTRLHRIGGTLAFALIVGATTAVSASTSGGTMLQNSDSVIVESQKPTTQVQLAYHPPGRGVRGPVYHYGYGPSCGPMVPTTRTMQNNLWQSHQWRGEYPVCQPLYAPNFGHFQTRWRSFPTADFVMEGPVVAPMEMPVTPAEVPPTPSLDGSITPASGSVTPAGETGQDELLEIQAF